MPQLDDIQDDSAETPLDLPETLSAEAQAAIRAFFDSLSSDSQFPEDESDGNRLQAVLLEAICYIVDTESDRGKRIRAQAFGDAFIKIARGTLKAREKARQLLAGHVEIKEGVLEDSNAFGLLARQALQAPVALAPAELAAALRKYAGGRASSGRKMFNKANRANRTGSGMDETSDAEDDFAGALFDVRDEETPRAGQLNPLAIYFLKELASRLDPTA